jgi:hypothetical protein
VAFTGTADALWPENLAGGRVDDPGLGGVAFLPQYPGQRVEPLFKDSRQDGAVHERNIEGRPVECGVTPSDEKPSLSGRGFGDDAETKRTEARLRAERVVADDLHDRIVREVIEAREAVRSRRAAIEVAEEELRAADEARTVTTKRLEQGNGSPWRCSPRRRLERGGLRTSSRQSWATTRRGYRVLVRVGRRPSSGH